jgi:hypothetical protein
MPATAASSSGDHHRLDSRSTAAAAWAPAVADMNTVAAPAPAINLAGRQVRVVNAVRKCNAGVLN